MSPTDDVNINVPSAWVQHWDGIPNSVHALYGTFQMTRFPWLKKKIRIEAWGQLCFDEAANNAIAYHMYNYNMRTGWKYMSWRVEMDGPPQGGGKLSGTAPDNFNIFNYVPVRK